MKTLRTYLQTLTLLLILLAGAPFAQGDTRPVGATPAPDSVEQRAGRVARYLAHCLGLSQHQVGAVHACTRQYLAQLSPSGAPQAADPAKAEKEYQLALGRILTPGQLNAYSWLQEHQPAGSR